MITEASPLNFPADATTSEYNFELDRTGKRSRRLGMNYEEGYNSNFGRYVTAEIPGTKTNTYVWEGVGENPELSFVVVQIGSRLTFHNRANSILSADYVGLADVGFARTHTFSFAAIDGDLIVATGTYVWRVKYDVTAPNSFTVEQVILKVRDQWGVADELDGENLREDGAVSKRPETTTTAHTYNLRNQGWGVPHASRGGPQGGLTTDLMAIAYSHSSYGKYPSNADIYHEWVKPDPNDSELQPRFFPSDYRAQPGHNEHAPQGYFVIDLMNRGSSRREAYQEMMDKFTELTVDIDPTEIPDDYIVRGPVAVEEYAGRLFYGGFNTLFGSDVRGDEYSPDLTNFVVFSQVVQNSKNIEKCYQEGDPTSPAESDLLPTDGGTVRISGVERILDLKAIGRSLFVVASNGLWRISGGTDAGFSADKFEVEKITDHGPTGIGSLVEFDGKFMYWADNGIFVVQPNELGRWTAQNISATTIQTYYEQIPVDGKANVKSVYDNFDRKIRWLYKYDEDSLSNDRMRELIFDVDLTAFTVNHFINQDIASAPKVIGYALANPFTTETIVTEVEDTGESLIITSGGDQIIIDEETTSYFETTPVVKYLTVYFEDYNSRPYWHYTFSELNNGNWKDWDVKDAAAHMTTGQFVGGDSSRDIMTPYLTFHMEKGEACTDSGIILPLCREYECDAYETTLINDTTSTGLWLLNTNTSYGNGDQIVAERKVGNLSAVGSTSPTLRSLQPDYCTDEWSHRFGGGFGGGSLYGTGHGHGGVGEFKFTLSAIFEVDTILSSRSITPFMAVYNQNNTRQISLVYRSDDSLQIIWQGSSVTYSDFASFFTKGTPHVLTFAYDFNDDESWALYKDHELIHSESGVARMGTLVGTRTGEIQFNTATQDAHAYMTHLNYWPEKITDSEANVLLRSWEQSHADFVETEECVDEEGQPVECTGVTSSCLVQSKWDNSYADTTDRWSRQFQVYREVRHQDEEFSVVTTRNKVRGRGAFYAMSMDTEELKDCRILGWNLAVAGNQHV